MAKLDLPDKWEEARGELAATVGELVAIVKGNGREGMVTTLRDFIIEHRKEVEITKTHQEEKAKEIKDAIAERDRQFNERDRKRSLAINIFMAIMAVLMFLVAWKDLTRKSSNEAPVIIEQQQSQPALSSQPPTLVQPQQVKQP